MTMLTAGTVVMLHLTEVGPVFFLAAELAQKR